MIIGKNGIYELFDADVELDKLYSTKQTNEKWFDSLSTKEKAEVISRLDCYHGNVYEIEQWLKDIHESEGNYVSMY